MAAKGKIIKKEKLANGFLAVRVKTSCGHAEGKTFGIEVVTFLQKGKAKLRIVCSYRDCTAEDGIGNEKAVQAQLEKMCRSVRIK